jgi:hypothetical protein
VLDRIDGRIRSGLRGLSRRGVKWGVPPSWFGYLHVQRETLPEYFVRRGDPGGYRTVHPAATAANPLPRNVESRDELPRDRGWWGYSFWDVPTRTSGETRLATLPGCRVATLIDSRSEFWVTVLNRDGRALKMREIDFRPWLAPVLRRRAAVPVRRATWVFERVYHNHSHWLTAHLPKFLLLRSLGGLADVLLPAVRPAAVDRSLRLFGLEPDGFRTFEPSGVLAVEELTILETDRFRPELLRLVRAECPIPAPPRPHRRVFISRLNAARRRLVNEEQLWPLLEAAGFERVAMEELSFEAQVRLMRETAVLLAPHGAGLTNMMFCEPGTHVLEIADLGFPNPNFYAVASAMGHHYWLLPAESLGDVHPLEKDLRIEPAAVEAVLARLA